MARAHHLAILAAALSGAVLWGDGARSHEVAPASREKGAGALAAPTDHGDTLPFDLGAPFSLIDHTGARRGDRDFRGRHMLIFFGYTSCPNTCSLALLNMARALDLMGSRAEAVQPILVSVDPEYDTPARLADFIARIDPRLVGLTGPAADIAKLNEAYRVAVAPVEDPGRFKRLVDHSSFIYLIGPDGGLETLLPPVLPPEHMARVIASYVDG